MSIIEYLSNNTIYIIVVALAILTVIIGCLLKNLIFDKLAKKIIENQKKSDK